MRPQIPREKPTDAAATRKIGKRNPPYSPRIRAASISAKRRLSRGDTHTLSRFPDLPS